VVVLASVLPGFVVEAELLEALDVEDGRRVVWVVDAGSGSVVIVVVTGGSILAAVAAGA
jgi:hypothetical protein